MKTVNYDFINNATLQAQLTSSAKTEPAKEVVNGILSKARNLKGLSTDEVLTLIHITDPEQLRGLFETAKYIKEHIYGKRLVIFAPLYTSNICANQCAYCAFSQNNPKIRRRRLSEDEIALDTHTLLKEGHKRVLLVAGEDTRPASFTKFLNAIDTVYSQEVDGSSIMRINVNLAPLTVDQFRELKKRKIGTYQIFQETYHRETYSQMHLKGPKTDYDWRLGVMDRAMEAGIDDVGIGALFGLYDWKLEILALINHAAHLEQTYGVGPHTISVPRVEPAAGSDLSRNPEHPVSDDDFYKLIAVLRLALPYTGIILSTRETVEVRRRAIELGVSQISAGSSTEPGGYNQAGADSPGQFELSDNRSLEEVIEDIAQMGHVPSFCTACYRLGRTGEDFMDLAKPGDIKMHCSPNALSSFEEYLRNCPNKEVKVLGQKAIERSLQEMRPAERHRAEAMLRKVQSGLSNICC